MSFTKLFSSITESTVWRESSDVRIVWITLLAMADQNGRVFASIPGLAGRAQVSVEVTEQALGKFLAPDKYSRTKDYDGRRIAEIDGGWELLTYAKHRDKYHEDGRHTYMRELMRQRRANNKLTAANVSTHDKLTLTAVSTEAEADKEEKETKPFVPPFEDATPETPTVGTFIKFVAAILQPFQ